MKNVRWKFLRLECLFVWRAFIFEAHAIERDYPHASKNKRSSLGLTLFFWIATFIDELFSFFGESVKIGVAVPTWSHLKRKLKQYLNDMWFYKRWNASLKNRTTRFPRLHKKSLHFFWKQIVRLSRTEKFQLLKMDRNFEQKTKAPNLMYNPWFHFQHNFLFEIFFFQKQTAVLWVRYFNHAAVMFLVLVVRVSVACKRVSRHDRARLSLGK